MGPENAKANFAKLAALVQSGTDRAAAARAIVQLPRESWDAATAGPVAESILAYAKTVPAGDRTKQEFVETVQTGMELASLLPPEKAATVRKELRALGVSVYVIKTVREQMRYDTPRLVVEAGKPFEVIFENVDLMPHNMRLRDARHAPGRRGGSADDEARQARQGGPRLHAGGRQEARSRACSAPPGCSSPAKRRR